MHFRLRTLLIVMAVVPPVASLFWWLVARTKWRRDYGRSHVRFATATLAGAVNSAKITKFVL